MTNEEKEWESYKKAMRINSDRPPLKAEKEALAMMRTMPKNLSWEEKNFRCRLTGDSSELVSTDNNRRKPARKLTKEEQEEDDEFIKGLYARFNELQGKNKNCK